MPFNQLSVLSDFQEGRRNALDSRLTEHRFDREKKLERRSDAMQEIQIINQFAKAIKKMPEDQWNSAVAASIPQLKRFGIDTSQFEGVEVTAEGLDQVIAGTQGLISDPSSVSQLSAGQRERSDLKQDLQGAINPQTGRLIPVDQMTAMQRNAAIGLKLIPAAGTVTSKERISIDKGLTEKVAESEKTIALSKEEGKLIAQFNLKPEVDAAVTTAVAEAKSIAEQSNIKRSNELAFNVYNAGMKGLLDGLTGTNTGPFVGWTPALTSNQQIADGAVAALAPVLKQLFRSSGEGVFTDKDQELLLKMVPTRKTTPEAIASQLNNVDAIVRAKLNIQSQQQRQQTQKGEGQIMIDANGNRARVFEDGTFEEL